MKLTQCTTATMALARHRSLRRLEKNPDLFSAETCAGFMQHPDGSVTQIMVKAYCRDSAGHPMPGQDDYLPPPVVKKKAG